MSVCIRCSIDKPAGDYRHKTSGPRAGYRFPRCIQCEGEMADAAQAAELRARGYDATARDPDVRTREEVDATERTR